jgi:hypothetical protein
MAKVPTYTQRAKENYRNSTLTVAITVNPRTEPELHNKLDGLPARSAYIKQLVLNDMASKHYE